MMKLRPDMKNGWFYFWLIFIIGPMATGCLEGAPSRMPLWLAAILSVVCLVVTPFGVVAMCGLNMSVQQLTGHFKPWRRPSLWTNPLSFHSLQIVVLLMVMVIAQGAGLFLRLLWGDVHAAGWSLVHFSGAAGLWYGLVLSLRFYRDRFEPAPEESRLREESVK